jgi:hypothetical protein
MIWTGNFRRKYKWPRSACLTSLTTKEMQIKTTLRFHLISQNGCPQEDKEQQMLVRMRGEKTFLHCWWECKLVKSLWKAVWTYLKKKNRTTIWFSDVHQDIYLHTYVYCTTTYNSQAMGTAQMPFEWPMY